MKNRHSIICASYLLLFKEEEVLLLRRYNTGYEDGNYSVPAGHVDKNETILDCLIRETEEETGLNLKKENVKLGHVMHRGETDDNDERLDFFFVVEKWDGEPKICEVDKCDDLSWFSLDDLPENIIPYIKNGIKSAREGILYSEIN